jgi:hypothetical protein
MTQPTRRDILARAALVGGGAAAWGVASRPPTAQAAPTYQSPIVTNVLDYGAIGDGSSDDAAAINAAIAATPYGGTVWFPRGTYNVGSTISLRQGVRCTGSNDWGATIQQAAGANLHAVMADTGYLTNASDVTDGVTLEYLTIDGRKDRNKTGHGIVLMTWRSLINKVTVSNTPDSGIVLSDVTIKGKTFNGSAIENRIENCSIDFTLGNGIWVMDHGFSGKVTDGYLLNNVVESCLGPHGIRIDRAAGWFIENNHVYDSQQSGFSLNQVWCTYFAFNEVDTFGLAAKKDATYTGVEVNWLLVDGRPSVFLGNISATAAQHGPKSKYVHYHVNGNNPGTARVTFVANTAHNDVQLELRNPGPPFHGRAKNATAFRYEAFPHGRLEVTDLANRSHGIGVERSVVKGLGKVKFVRDSPTLDMVKRRGDLLVGTGPGAMTALPPGKKGEVLFADPGSPTGLRWGRLPG